MARSARAACWGTPAAILSPRDGAPAPGPHAGSGSSQRAGASGLWRGQSARAHGLCSHCRCAGPAQGMLPGQQEGGAVQKGGPQSALASQRRTDQALPSAGAAARASPPPSWAGIHTSVAPRQQLPAAPHWASSWTSWRSWRSSAAAPALQLRPQAAGLGSGGRQRRTAPFDPPRRAAEQHGTLHAPP